MYTRRIQLTNYGPIDEVNIVCPFEGDKPKPVVLVGENGSGKSLVLSHIVNGLLLAQQAAYPETPEVTAGKVYKLHSPSYVKSGCEFSFSRVEFEHNLNIGELQLAKRRQDYDEVPSGILGTDAEQLWRGMDPAENSVFLPRFNDGHIQELFERNCILYFPPNRFEDPAWLNEENLKATARNMNLRHLKGHTDRIVVNHSPLHDNKNWLFDVVFDFRAFELQTHHIAIPVEGQGKSRLTAPVPVFAGFSGKAKTAYDIALRVVQAIIQGSNIRFGIGPRRRRVISVMENDQSRVPNIFQLSSGEMSLLNMFLSILRDFDLCGAPFTKSEDVRGIVVVDEIDVHLHTIHQYEILPKLVQMFPRVQFILTTHSPLFVLGLQHALKHSGFGLYQLPQGQEIAPEEFDEFGDTYRVFKETNTYLAEIEATAKKVQKPLVVVEGKTDTKYLSRATELLGWHDTLHDLEICNGGGDGNLKNAWKTLTKWSFVHRPIILLHDCESNVSPRESDNVFRRQIPFIEGHPIRKGIENLFSGETLEKTMAHKPAFVDIIDEHEAIERGESKTIPKQWKINEDEKSNLCNWLCENGTVEDFQCFDRILDELRGIPGMLRLVTDDHVDEDPARGD